MTIYEGLTDEAKLRYVEGPDDTWALLKPGTRPTRILLPAGTDSDARELVLVPADQYVKAQNKADSLGRTLALINSRLSNLGINDPYIQKLLKAEGYTPELADSVNSLIAWARTQTVEDRQ